MTIGWVGSTWSVRSMTDWTEWRTQSGKIGVNSFSLQAFNSIWTLSTAAKSNLQEH